MRSRIYLGMAKLEGGEPAESAIQEASIATELSRRSDMPQGVVFGLMLMARALSSLGRKEEALQRSSEAMALVATGTPIVGVEEALHEHAKVLRDLGRTTEARPFLERALKEIRKKVRRLKTPERQQSFLAVKPIRDVLATYALVIGPIEDLTSAT
jgi:tetratricopeptide (TPR) repeat protein